MSHLNDGDLCEVIGGDFAGAKVVFHFVNNLGNLDCRFAEGWGAYQKGWVIVLRPDQVKRVEPRE